MCCVLCVVGGLHVQGQVWVNLFRFLSGAFNEVGRCVPGESRRKERRCCITDYIPFPRLYSSCEWFFNIHVARVFLTLTELEGFSSCGLI